MNVAAAAVRPGLLVLDKPSGWTSHDVVGRVRRLAGTSRVGHAGTLDPMATGVLVLGIARATRLLTYLVGADKQYLATMVLGVSTTTDDAEGEPTEQHDASSVTDEALEAAVARQRGSIDQVPSSVSAIKIDGRRAYARVRAGETVQLASRAVTVSRLLVTDVRRQERTTEADLLVECSSGTYVRALARDIGDSLGVGGHLRALRRTRVGPFTMDDAHDLAEITPETIGDALLGLPAAAARCFHRVDLDEQAAADVRHGRSVPATGLGEPVAAFAPDGQFLALLADRGPAARPLAVFVG